MKFLLLFCLCMVPILSYDAINPNVNSSKCVFDLVRVITKLENVIDDLDDLKLSPQKMITKVIKILPTVEVATHTCQIQQNQTFLVMKGTCNELLEDFVNKAKELLLPDNNLQISILKLQEILNYIQAINDTCQINQFTRFSRKPDFPVAFQERKLQLVDGIDEAASCWILISTCLIILMAPGGLTLFYGGLTQRKNVLNTIGMSYVAFLITLLTWYIIGYSLAFKGNNQFIGTWNDFLLLETKFDDIHRDIPARLMILFQGCFAAVAVALIGGSVVERIKFSTWLLFSTLWGILVYPIIAHWVWSEQGFLLKFGHIDFAGGTVVHVNSGVSALVICLMVGKRRKEENKHSSLELMILGTALLWFGWLGFNGGNGRDKNLNMKAGFVATNALLVTNIGACTGGLTWMLIEWLVSDQKKPTLIGIGSGVVSGLVGSTSLAGFVDFKWALLTGVISGAIGYWSVVKLKKMLNLYDDTLDVFGIHGVVGIWGAIATGLFSNPEINENGVGGAIYGNWNQLYIQIVGTTATVLYSAIASAILFKISSLALGGHRIKIIEEEKGLDKAFHKEKAFDLAEELERQNLICVMCQRNSVGPGLSVNNSSHAMVQVDEL